MAGKKQVPAAPQLEKVKPKTKNQAAFLKAIHDNDVVICDGPAGSGKSLLSIALGCEWLLAGKMEKILISRTLIGCGDVGTFPGTEAEKSEPYFFAHLDYLDKILGKSRSYIDNGNIVLKPLEMLRGTTFDKTLMILDEAQNCDGKQIKMFLSRLGHYSKAIVIGDLTQSDIGNPAGFRFCTNYLQGLENCAVVTFDYNDILRNSKIGHILEAFDKGNY